MDAMGACRGVMRRIVCWLCSVFTVGSAIVGSRSTSKKAIGVWVGEKGPLLSALTALAICVVNALIGFVVARWAFGRELNTFLSVVFGSFGVRAVLVIVGVWACLGPLNMDQVAFAITFAISCFVFLMGEILFFHQWFEKQKRQVRPPVSELLKKNFIKTLTNVPSFQCS